MDALEKLGVQRVIGLAHDGGNAVIEGTPSLAAKYHTAIASQTIATKTDVQAIIDTVNGAEVTKLVVAAEAAVTTDSVTAAASLLAAYDNGIADDKVEVDLGKRLDVVTALVAVNAAPDAAGLLTAIKSADLALVEVVDANADAYKAQVDAQAEGFKFATVAQLQSFVKQVNATVNTSAIDAVNKAVDAPALLTALKSSVLGLKKVADANEAASGWHRRHATPTIHFLEYSDCRKTLFTCGKKGSLDYCSNWCSSKYILVTGLSCRLQHDAVGITKRQGDCVYVVTNPRSKTYS